MGGHGRGGGGQGARPGAPRFVPRIPFALVPLVGLLCALACVASAEERRHYIGEAACVPCHVVETEHWGETVHAEVFRHRPRNLRERRSCEACHGLGSAHQADPTRPDGIRSFTKGASTPVEEQNDTCLACHPGAGRLYWYGSAHQAEGLSCADCHDPMTQRSPTGLLRRENTNETCFTCHPRQRMEFRKRSHMPLLEGKLSCGDCHDPHGTPSKGLLLGDSVNQLCYSCHAEKRGPFLFEHAPVSENCLHCHLAHGSNREQLLTASPPMLCQQCHIQQSIRSNHASALMTRGNLAGGVQPDDRLMNRGCANCHSRVHGSNHPSGARLQR